MQQSKKQRNMSERKRAQLAFFIAIVAFGLQYIISANYGEPYPAIKMPGFKGDGGSNKQSITLNRLKFIYHWENGDLLNITHLELLSEFPGSHKHAVSHFFRKLFFLPLKQMPNEIILKKNKTDLIFRGYKLGERRLQTKQGVSDLLKWLRKRGKLLGGKGNPIRLEIKWYKEFWQNKDRFRLSKSKKLFKKLELNFSKDIEN